MGHLFPLFLDLNNKNCLVVGGGKVAERKVADLLDYGAVITVVSPELSPELVRFYKSGRIECRMRKFGNDDLEGVFLAIIATNDNKLNQAVAAECRAKSILVNTVDDPPNCDFFVPAVLRRGPLALAISTEGNSPMFARRLREELERNIGDEYGEFVEILGNLRPVIQERVSDISKRQEILETLVYSDILELLQAGEREKVRERIEQCMSSLQG